jgi:peptide/nickel transport system substrate-binding protein
MKISEEKDVKKPQVSKKEMEKIHRAIPDAYEKLEQGRISRREFMRHATLLGMSAGVAAIAAACGAPEARSAGSGCPG